MSRAELAAEIERQWTGTRDVTIRIQTFWRYLVLVIPAYRPGVIHVHNDRTGKLKSRFQLSGIPGWLRHYRIVTDPGSHLTPQE